MKAITTSSPPWGFRAYLTKPHDGDSFWMMCDLGFGARYEAELRLEGVRAPELNQEGGEETSAYVNGWFAGHAGVARRWPFWVAVTMTTVLEPSMRQSFTRYVATVWPFDAKGLVDVSPAYQDSLNFSVVTFLSGHPEWPSGD